MHAVILEVSVATDVKFALQWLRICWFWRTSSKFGKIARFGASSPAGRGVVLAHCENIAGVILVYVCYCL